MFDLSTEEARLLLNIALMATGGNRFSSAARILAALESYRVDQVSIASAKTVALMSAMRFREAVEYVDEVALKKFPNDPMLLAFKGMALFRMERRDEAREPLEAAAKQEENPAAKHLAEDLLKDLDA